MWNKTPTVIWPTAGDAEGITDLNAFDNALLAAGIGNLNLVKLSSVIPAGVKVLDGRPADMKPGDLAPMIYTRKTSSTPGDVVAAAIGLGFTKDGHGVAFEHTDGSREAVESVVRAQVAAGFQQRGLVLDHIIVVSSEHKVEHIGCALAACALWWVVEDA